MPAASLLFPPTSIVPPPNGGDTGGGGGGGTSGNAVWADVIPQSQGVNIHLAKDTTWIYRIQGPGYTTAVDTLLAKVDYLGVRAVREDFQIGNAYERSTLKAFGSAGIKCLIMPGTLWNGATPPTAAKVAAEISSQYASFCIGVEGLNESDLSGRNTVVSGVPQWVTLTRDYQQALYTAIHALGIPVLSPSLAGNSSSKYADLGNVDQWADIGNVHGYNGATKASAQLASKLTNSQKYNVPSNQPTWITECGDHDAYKVISTFPPLTEEISGIYAPVMALETYRTGYGKSFRYELADDRREDTYGTAAGVREKHFGLYAWNAKVGVGQSSPAWRAKPNAVALHNLNGLFADPGTTYTPTPISVTITGGDASLRYFKDGSGNPTVFGKRDGTYLLPIWRDVASWAPSTTVSEGGKKLTVAAQTITVTFDVSRLVRRYQPSTQAGSLASSTGTSYSFPVAGEAVVLKIG